MNFKISILLLLASFSAHGQDYDFLSKGVYSDDPIVTPGFEFRLNDLEEELINKLEICDDCEIFRFSWLRSFDNPIIIRLERKIDSYKLFYKIGKGAAGYDTEGLKKSKSLKVTSTEWNYFIDLVNKSGFDTIPNQYYFPMTDGASWVLEHRTGFNYKGHKTNDPIKEFEVSCLYLLELANINYGQKDFDLDYANQRIFLNKRNEIINEQTIKISILDQMNKFIANNKLDQSGCYYDDYIFSIHPNGKINKIKPYKDVPWFEYKLWQFESRKCRTALKVELRKLDLSYLKLDRKIKVNMGLIYDKAVNKFKLDTF